MRRSKLIIKENHTLYREKKQNCEVLTREERRRKFVFITKLLLREVL